MDKHRHAVWEEKLVKNEPSDLMRQDSFAQRHLSLQHASPHWPPLAVELMDRNRLLLRVIYHPKI